jgi:hypothetical protein
MLLWSRSIVGKPRKLRVPCEVCLKVMPNLRSRYCSNTCQMEAQYLAYIERWKAGEETGCCGTGRNLAVSNHVKRYLQEKYGERCTRCGWAERNPKTGRVPLNVEHRDGNPYNSVEANLTLLCPNCHSLTPTFGNLNAGNGRTKRTGSSSNGRTSGWQSENPGSNPGDSTTTRV